MNKWNNVDECLPSIGASVVVNSVTSGVTDGMFVHEDRKHNFLKWIVNGALCFDVTHWQVKDYPKPPQEKLEKEAKCPRFDVYEFGGVSFIRFDGDDDAAFPASGIPHRSENLVAWLNEIWKEKKAEKKSRQFDRVLLLGAHYFRFDLDPSAIFPVCEATSHPVAFTAWVNEMLNR